MGPWIGVRVKAGASGTFAARASKVSIRDVAGEIHLRDLQA